ncbi:MAG: integrase core domain-containing protein [Planctomycetota bacterium]
MADLKKKGNIANALPVASPNLNGRVERFIQTIKYECLFKFILFGQRHLDHIVVQWVDYYNKTRSHMERGHLPPIREVSEVVPKLERDQIIVRSYVGGLVRSFERSAA